MNQKRKSFFRKVIAVSAGLLLAGCGSQEESSEVAETSQAEGEKLQVVTTFYPMYEFTQKVAQDMADVSMLLPAGTDSHGYEPSARDVANITEADVFVYNSEEMETWVPSVLDNIDTEAVVTVTASEGIELLEYTGDEHIEEEHEEHEHAEDEHTEEEHAEEGHNHDVDPHVWLDPVLAQELVRNIAEGLSEADPENAEIYEANAEDYISELELLDQEFTAAFEEAENRTFVTQHAAFAYLAERYDLQQVAIAGVSTEEEPSPARLAELNDFVEANNVEYIYFAEATNSSIAETLASETGTELATLNAIEGVTEEEQATGLNYIEAMRNNLISLQKSIQ